MARDPREALLPHYQRELGYLRRMGQAFAETYPKIASRLDLAGAESPDPHVERLIESFAFLTGRIQQNIDAEFPEIPQGLLGILYPQFVDPVPSMSIAQYMVDSARGKLTDGYDIPRGSELFTTAPNGMTCRFRTIYPVTLWPIEVREADIESTDQYEFLSHYTNMLGGSVGSVLRVRIETTADPLNEMSLDQLRFHLHADPVTAAALLEQIFVGAMGVALVPDGNFEQAVVQDLSALRTVGFEREDAVIPVPPHGHPAYQLLRELFSFPQKFHYCDVSGIAKTGAKDRLDILLLLRDPPPRSLSLEPENFRLFTTPVVNLFSKTSEPIRLDGRQTEYRLVGDRRRELTTEIHSIKSVTASNQENADAIKVEPFFSFSHAAAERNARAFWFATRRETPRAELRGTDLYLSFVDLDYLPTQPSTTTLFAHTLCTNRGLAEQLRSGASLHSEMAAPVSDIVAIYKPTPQAEPPIGGETLWRLISHLSLNYLSLSQFEGSLSALKEILRLYSDPTVPGTERVINGITKMECRRSVERMGSDHWRGFARGVEVILTLDKKAFVGSSAILMSAVLDRFFGLYASINSFSQLTIKSTDSDEEWKKWPPRAGEHHHL